MFCKQSTLPTQLYYRASFLFNNLPFSTHKSSKGFVPRSEGVTEDHLLDPSCISDSFWSWSHNSPGDVPNQVYFHILALVQDTSLDQTELGGAPPALPHNYLTFSHLNLFW